MSDVARLRQVLPARSQLPVSWYFDADHFALEKRLLFDAGANYVGHSLMVPEVGDYHTLAWTDHARMLVHNDAGIDLLSNVCRHRQAIMLEGRGNAQNIVCPLHRWTYDLKGELLGAPHFAESPCVKLRSIPLTEWQGLLFAGPRNARQDLAKITTAADWDFRGYVLDSVRVDDYEVNWKTFVEVYLEEGFPVDLVIVDAHRIEHVASEVPVRGGGDLRQVLARIAWAGEQQSLPLGERD